MSTPGAQEALLKSLAIDRAGNQAQPGAVQRRFIWPAVLVVLALILGGVAGNLWTRGSAADVLVAADSLDPVDATRPDPGRAADNPSVAAVDSRSAPRAVEASAVLNASGYVIARRAATVSSKTTGKVEAVLIEEGMAVAAGQVLARLDSRLETAQLVLLEAQVEAAVALSDELDADIGRVQVDLQRWQALAARGLSSQSDLDELNAELATLLSRQLRTEKEVVVAQRRVEMQRVRVDDQTIRAPFAGTVVKKSAQPGEMISPVSAGGGFTRTGICTIVDMASLEVEVDVNESYINRVFPGQLVTIRLTAYPDSAYPGEVLAVIPTADRSKATIRVRLKFLQADERVLPNMGLQVAFLEGRVSS